ncbi:MAG: OB-fold nucleic acid binding domain-containing protein [Planctomycetota bacterium]
MTRTLISDLADGQTVEQAFRTADKQLRVNRQGGKYLFVRLSDRSGAIVTMMWNADEAVFDAFDRGDYVYCHGRTQIHNGQLQIIATRLDRMDPAEIDASDFDAYDSDQADVLLARLRDLLGSLECPDLRSLAKAYLNDDPFMAGFQRAAAAVNNHHAYPGGLLQHTVDLMELARLVAPRYPRINAELVLVGAFLHDSGKVEELSHEGEIHYSDAGQLLGHIVLGLEQLQRMVQVVDAEREHAFPKELLLHLQHLILSHHGQLDYGSPKVPMSLEAVLLHHLDNMDAKMAAFGSLIDADVSGDAKWTNYIPSIGRKLWKGGAA